MKIKITNHIKSRGIMIWTFRALTESEICYCSDMIELEEILLAKVIAYKLSKQ